MSPVAEGDEVGRRAEWIAGHSRIATIGDFVVGRSIASVRSSRAVMLARRWRREFQSLPAGERTRCVLIACASALAGHVLLAALVPTAASPTLSVTTLALLGVGVGAGASAK